MSIFYKDITGKDIVFVDTQEKDRAERFKKYFDDYIDNHKKPEVMDIIKNKRKKGKEYFKTASLDMEIMLLMMCVLNLKIMRTSKHHFVMET